MACKTGTSTDFRDNWAIGYTPEFTVGVWVGNFDGRPMVNVSGVTGAGPLLHEVFARLHAAHPTTWYEPPPGVVARTVHRVTGHLLPAERANDPDAMTEHFLADRLPPPESPADYDPQGRVRLPAEYASWLDSGDNWLAGRAVAPGGKPGIAPDPPSFAVLSPIPGTIYVLDPDLPPSSRLLDLARARLRRSALGKPDPGMPDGPGTAHRPAPGGSPFPARPGPRQRRVARDVDRGPGIVAWVLPAVCRRDAWRLPRFPLKFRSSHEHECPF